VIDAMYQSLSEEKDRVRTSLADIITSELGIGNPYELF